MLELTSEIIEHLKSAGTLLVPSRQRATAVRVAYSAAMLAAGLRVWSSPDVLPWTAWVERSLDEARARGESVPRRLSTSEEWLLWQEAVHEATAGFGLLTPEAIVEPVRRAVGLVDDFGLNLAPEGTAEAAVLRQSRALFERRCESLQLQGTTSWRQCAKFLRPSSKLLLAGFSVIGRQRRGWLSEHHAGEATGNPASGSTQILDFESPAHEADAAAEWCASMLARDGAARMLIVVPQLPEQRHLWERAFSQRLDQASLYAGEHAGAEAAFAIEGGRPLKEYRLVATALRLLSLASGEGRFDELSELLRSPYLSIDASHRLRIDRWLRERNVDIGRLRVLRSLLPLLKRDLDEAVSATASALLERLEGLAQRPVAACADWARTWAEMLQQCGWPGPGTLSSDEQQVRMRFDELLGDFASITVPARKLGPEEAWRRFHQMAQRVAFDPATDDVPVTISARLEDPIVRYDGIWVAGLSADTWPPAARPDPLIPLTLQYSAGIPTAIADGQLRLAQTLQQQWQRCAKHCVMSWSRSAEDLPRDPSPLLPQTGIPQSALAYAPGSGWQSAESWQVGQAPALKRYTDTHALPVSPDEELAGGTKLLELQSLCPFRAVAQLRLHAEPLPRPLPGIDARLRGMILHEALEQFWNSMGDQSRLHNTSQVETRELIVRCAASAIEKTLRREPGEFSTELVRRERLRAERLIDLLLTWERARGPFSTPRVESTLRLNSSGRELELRLDRVDQLPDGRSVIIDYKTGKPKTFKALAERLPQPQLPAYAIASGQLCAAVVTLYLGREGATPRGIADRADRVSQMRKPKGEVPDWTQLMQRWQRQLASLIEEFLHGNAAVDPQPDACTYCHLRALCRIDAASIPMVEEEEEELDDDIDEVWS